MPSEIPYLPDGAPYKMATIHQLTRFSPELLRAWERRHGLLKPKRGPGGHRLYTQDDLRVLLRVKDLLGGGRSIGEVARVGRETLLTQFREPSQAEPVVNGPTLAPVTDLEALEQVRRCRDRIVTAALELDSRGMERALDDAFARFLPETVIFHVMAPAAQEIGELWVAGRCSVANEHLASGIFLRRLLKLLEAAQSRHSDSPPIVVACLPDEYHQLGALALGYLLERSGARVIYLGAALPLEDLEGACDTLRPRAAVLSATRSAIYQIHRRELAQVIRRRRGKVQFHLGGQGVPPSDPELQQAGARLASPGTPLNSVISEILSACRVLSR